jgi:hypothetical protein
MVDGTPQRDTSFTLTAGEHIVRWSAPGLVTVEDTIRLADGDTLPLAFRRVHPERLLAERQAETPAVRPPQPPPPNTGLVRIRVRPTWATIFVDAVRRADDIRHQEELPPGIHAFRFERDGYFTVDTSVTLQRGDTVALEITLRPSGGN